MMYNIYFGTIATGAKYQFTKNVKTEEEAKELAKSGASSLYYRNEGKHGIPSFKQISEESQITGLPIKDLYNEHIVDMMRWYAIPTDIDTIPNKKLKY